MRDCVAKNRNKPHIGNLNPNRKLTESDVIEIRRKYTWFTYGIYKLAKEFKVSASVIMSIIQRKAWKHV